jgi:hypothetical protein
MGTLLTSFDKTRTFLLTYTFVKSKIRPNSPLRRSTSHPEGAGNAHSLRRFGPNHWDDREGHTSRARKRLEGGSFLLCLQTKLTCISNSNSRRAYSRA